MTMSVETAKPSKLNIVGQLLFWLVVVIGAFVVYKFSWMIGTFWLFACSLAYILLILKPEQRLFALWVWFSLLIFTVVSSVIQQQLATNQALIGRIQASEFWSFLLDGYGETVFWSIVMGAIVTLVVIMFALFIVAYTTAIYVLALPEANGIGWQEAIGYVGSLLIGWDQPIIVVENGQALTNEKAGKLEEIGGPGELIIKEGNIVVLERGGKISRIVNAGVRSLKPLERIRNILSLASLSNTKEIEGALTRDGIPLKITMSASFQLESAMQSDERLESRMAPHGVALTERLDDGLYQVYVGTIRKAALINLPTAEAWKNAACSVPEADLRDYILSYDFDELFHLITSPDGKPEVRIKQRTIYEIEQAILSGMKGGKLSGLGVVVKNVDIGRIEFPPKLVTALIESKSSSKRAHGQAEAIGTVGNAKTDAVTALFDRILTLIATELPYADEDMVRQLVAVLQSVYRDALTDDVLVKELLEANSEAIKKFAESEGPKYLTPGILTDPAQFFATKRK